MSPVTDDRGVGPRAMADRKWESVHFCIDCDFSTVHPEDARVHRRMVRGVLMAMDERHRIKTRKRHRVLK